MINIFISVLHVYRFGSIGLPRSLELSYNNSNEWRLLKLQVLQLFIIVSIREKLSGYFKGGIDFIFKLILFQIARQNWYFKET